MHLFGYKLQICLYKGTIVYIFRAQTRKVQGPIDFVRILLLFFFYYSGIFGGLNMVKNSFAHSLEPVAVRTPLRLGPGRSTKALRRPLKTIRKLDV